MSENPVRALRAILDENGIPYARRELAQWEKFCDTPVEARPKVVKCLMCDGTGTGRMEYNNVHFEGNRLVGDPCGIGKCDTCHGTGKISQATEAHLIRVAYEMSRHPPGRA